VREILQAMRDTDSRTLLDVCCGTGRAVKVALDQGYDATWIDVSPHLLGIARRELGIPERRLILGDATSLPFPDGAFDVCCILGALHHTAMPIKLVSEMIRVTRNAIVISDEANGLCGGIKQVLIGLGIFDPVYRLLFRRPPRSHRRMGLSDRDGPTYAFSIEEIIPMLKSQFQGFKCLTFYRVGTRQICSYKLPRLFARQGVLTVKTKRV
jgi:SAM-dependent methyltransferase